MLYKLCESIAVMEMMKIMFEKSYSELVKLKTFKERYDYLKLNGVVAHETFGYDRYLNQDFYKSKEWKNLRDKIIIRDDGFDLGLEGYDIGGVIYVHHINPIKPDDIYKGSSLLFDPDNLICCSFNTHQAIHYGDDTLIPQPPLERKPGDTILW